MKEVYATWLTEYEFGQRPEGVNFSEDLKELNATIRKIHAMGDPESYTRCSEPIKLHVVPKVWRKYARKKKTVFWENELPEGFYKVIEKK
jgi:hypothetical protein